MKLHQLREGRDFSGTGYKDLAGWHHVHEVLYGDLEVNETGLDSFKNAPKEISQGGLYAAGNNLSSFEGAPKKVDRPGVNLCNNKFTSLHNIHLHMPVIRGNLVMSGCPIKSHALGVLLIDGLDGFEAREQILGEWQYRLTTITDDDSLKVRNTWWYIIDGFLPNGRGNAALYECQEALIKAGFEEYAHL